MKKALLLCAAALFSLMASAGDGIIVVGANITVLPSSRYDGNVEWKAYTWVYNSTMNFNEPHNKENPNFNVVCGSFDGEGGGPMPDAQGKMWFEPGFDMSWKEGDLNYDVFDDVTGEETPIYWEEHAAPFSSDANYNGRPSYRWATNDLMADIYARRTFTTDMLLSGPVYLACGHDDSPCEYYLNGELIFSRTGWEEDGNGNVINGWNNDEYILLTDEQKSLIKLGGEENLLAFHVHQNWGGAFADCGLYTKIEGGLDMGYQEPWEGKVLFNNIGGYNFDGASPSNDPHHPWSKLYEAQEGDVYTFVMPGATDEEEETSDMEQLAFKSPIKIEAGHEYNFTAKISSDQDFTAVVLKLGDNDFDDIELAYEDFVIDAGEETEINIDFEGESENFMFLFDFGGGKEGATVSISDISLYDATDDKELWVGTHYFNYINMYKGKTTYFIWDDDISDYREAKTEEEIEMSDYNETEYSIANAPEIEGRHETLAWTLPDFDDSMWDDQMMPVGNMGYNPRPASNWPGCGSENYYYEGDGREGENTNYWIRRNFEMEKVNERLSYALNVCHDDVYETYVNGHLLQKNTGWTNGKSPVQVHIPAKYLREGKNVIATYIQQNWGGRFYDCGINVEEVNYDECAQLLKDAIAYAKTDTLLTNKMKADVLALTADAQNELATNKDAAEVKNYAKEFKAQVNSIFAYSSSVLLLKQTLDVCRTIEDKGYLATAIANATAALDTCSTSGTLNPNLDRLRDARKANAMERHNENYVGCVPEIVPAEEVGDFLGENPKYYIYNVGAKLFLGGGESWGTHLALEYISNPMMLVQKMNEEEPIEGVFCVETFRPNGNIGTNDFMNWGGFIDTGEQSAWELIPVEGKTNVYNIAQYGATHSQAGKTYDGTEYEAGGRKLLGLRSGDNGYAPSYYVVDTDMHTAELETNQWMFVTREEMLGLLATASVDNPVDLSFLIGNPDYDQRLDIDGYWSTGHDGGYFGVWGRNDNHTNFVFEAFSTASFNVSQMLWPDEMDEALPAGTYVLTVQAYYRDGLEQAHVDKVLKEEALAQRAIIYAGSTGVDVEECESMPVMPVHIEANQVPGIGWTSNPGNMRMPGGGDGCNQAAENYFKNGLYKNYLPFTISAEDAGSIQFGIMKEADEVATSDYGDWCVMDNWRLKYYGGEPIDPDGIKGIESDEIKKTTATSKGIYNLLGQKLTKAQRGVNIIGGKKIVKK